MRNASVLTRIERRRSSGALHSRVRRGFTIIELLVVVTIIIVLLALLTPAIDKAMYQAELAVCAANLDAGAAGVTAYAFDHGRHYPHRPAVSDTLTGNYMPQVLALPFGMHNKGNMDGYDDRPMLRPYLKINGLLCPLVDRVDLDHSLDGTMVFASYELWFGWRYLSSAGGRGMFKIGSGLEFDNTRYFALAGDVFADTNGAVYPFHSSHPDRNRVAWVDRYQDEPYLGAATEVTVTWSEWVGTSATGPTDLHFAFEDGSVRRMTDVDPSQVEFAGDDRFDKVPLVHRNALTAASAWRVVPKTR